MPFVHVCFNVFLQTECIRSILFYGCIKNVGHAYVLWPCDHLGLFHKVRCHLQRFLCAGTHAFTVSKFLLYVGMYILYKLSSGLVFSSRVVCAAMGLCVCDKYLGKNPI